MDLDPDLFAAARQMGRARRDRTRFRIRRVAHACGLFLQHQGTFRPFLFDDPTDNTVADQVLGTGDGGIRTFQLVRTMGRFAEPITAPNVVSAIRFNGVHQNPTNYTIERETGMVTFATPPPAGHVIAADFTYRFRVRFAEDSAEFENFLYQLWQLKQIKLQSVLQ